MDASIPSLLSPPLAEAPSAKPEAHGSARSAASALVHLPFAGPPLYVVGLNEGELGVEGWHARSRDERCGVATRPAEPRAFWTIPLPLEWRRSPRPRAGLRALLCAAPSLLGGLVTARLMVSDDPDGRNGHWSEAAVWEFRSNNWCWREASLDLSPARWGGRKIEKLRLRLDTEPLLIPAKALGNRDYREMGVQWGALRLFEAASGATTHEG